MGLKTQSLKSGLWWVECLSVNWAQIHYGQGTKYNIPNLYHKIESSESTRHSWCFFVTEIPLKSINYKLLITNYCLALSQKSQWPNSGNVLHYAYSFNITNITVFLFACMKYAHLLWATQNGKVRSFCAINCLISYNFEEVHYFN